MSQAPTKDAVITKVAGPDKVSLGAAASGSVMNTARTYTLKFAEETFYRPWWAAI